ncbi:MAG TPA: hypothetical protein VEY71_12015, partial [Chitinophagales bacterium]|nr:hypothetical protein [Chitinophagales bacterium]
NFFKRENRLVCEVDDNGIGRKQSQLLKTGSTVPHRSLGIETTEKRLSLLGKRQKADYNVTVFDKANERGEPAGTTVVLSFPLLA